MSKILEPVALHLPEEEEKIWMAASARNWDYFSTNSKYTGEVFEEMFNEHGIDYQLALPEEVFDELVEQDLYRIQTYPEAYDEAKSKEYVERRLSLSKVLEPVALHLPEEEEKRWMEDSVQNWNCFSTNSKYTEEVFEDMFSKYGTDSKEILPEEVFWELELNRKSDVYKNYEPYPEAYDEEVSKDYSEKRISFSIR